MDGKKRRQLSISVEVLVTLWTAFFERRNCLSALRPIVMQIWMNCHENTKD